MKRKLSLPEAIGALIGYTISFLIDKAVTALIVYGLFVLLGVL